VRTRAALALAAVLGFAGAARADEGRKVVSTYRLTFTTSD
jgi:hypothetical protein